MHRGNSREWPSVPSPPFRPQHFRSAATLKAIFISDRTACILIECLDDNPHQTVNKAAKMLSMAVKRTLFHVLNEHHSRL